MLNIVMKKYAFCKQMIDAKGNWLLQPWINAGARIYDSITQVPDDCILISIHHPPWRNPYKEWIAKGNAHIEIDYGYWGINTPRRNTRRVTYKNSHNVNMKNPPYSRLKTLEPQIQDWKIARGEYLLLIEPQPTILTERTGLLLGDWQQQLLGKLEPYWAGPIKWRRKAGGKNAGRWPSFLEDLKGCHAVVGERTMACVEAVMLGYPAYTVDFSTVSLLMGTDLSAIQQPIFPDRTAWLEHVAWSQFSPEEFLNGTTIVEMVEEYQM